MAIAGGLLVLVGILAYLAWIFGFHRFSYRTWIFDAVVEAGMLLAAANWFQRGGDWLSQATILLGLLWFVVSRVELRLRGSKELRLRVGDPLPAMDFVRTNGTPFTDRDLVAAAPALLTLYRGWWCPTSRAQLDGFHQYYENLRQRGVSIYAASVDGPEEAQPIQESVGDHITILCNASEALLEKIGVLDRRGAPWYDRLLYGAPHQPIAMPTALVVNRAGKVIFVARSTRLDDRPSAERVLATLSLAAG